jgi:hypothetical protein
MVDQSMIMLEEENENSDQKYEVWIFAGLRFYIKI